MTVTRRYTPVISSRSMLVVEPKVSDGLSREDILAQLETILVSSSFSSSKRCRDFLRYVVTESVEGRAEGIKERTIASDVFGKDMERASEEDSLVRVKAREVRKRLASFYEATLDAPIRIELPLGGYAPVFRLVAKSEAVATLPVAQIPPIRQPASVRRRNWPLLCAPFILIAVAALTFYWSSRYATPLYRFWRPVLEHREPLVVFFPLLTQKNESTGEVAITDRVGVGASAAAVRLAAYMTAMKHPYVLKSGQDLSFSDLRRQPSVLLGGFSSFWTLEMERGLRFQLVRGNYQRVVDTQTKQEWLPVGTRPHGYADEDYGIASRLIDSKSGQIMLIAAGTTTFGTQSAAEFLLDPAMIAELVKKAPKNWESKNFEAVIHTSIIGATPGPPKVVATYFW